jgi:hypothetical protein
VLLPASGEQHLRQLLLLGHVLLLLLLLLLSPRGTTAAAAPAASTTRPLLLLLLLHGSAPASLQSSTTPSREPRRGTRSTRRHCCLLLLLLLLLACSHHCCHHVDVGRAHGRHQQVVVEGVGQATAQPPVLLLQLVPPTPCQARPCIGSCCHCRLLLLVLVGSGASDHWGLLPLLLLLLQV